jgi:hypothetical protein
MQWLKTRAVELGAALCTAGVLVGGLAAGVPFLRARIPETMLYSACCIAAVLFRAMIYLAAEAAVRAAHVLRPGQIVIAPLSAYRARVVR